MFKEVLKSGESLFRDTVWLSYDFQPKLVQHREQEQERFAAAVRPLLQGHTGRNLFVHGEPGIGKTTACKHVLRELEQETEEIFVFYVNGWKENTTYKIFYQLCLDLGMPHFRIQNKKTSELFALIRDTVNQKSAVFVFDEIDKLEELDFLYTILEDIYRKSIILITNYRDMYTSVDARIRSRLNPEFVFFRPYNEQEIANILKQRRDYAFVPGCWEEEAFTEIIQRAVEARDVRIGLYLMREAGTVAEEKSSRSISLEHVAEAGKKAEDFHIKPIDGLDAELQEVLNLVKDSPGQRIGELYAVYTQRGGEMSYKSFQRRISRLHEGNFVSTEKVQTREGNTTIVNYATEKKLTDF